MFLTAQSLPRVSWQALERAVSRLLLHEGYSGVRVVGQTGDRGADILAHKFGRRWLFQVKHWRNRVGPTVIDQTISALASYRAQVPVVVARSGFESTVETQRMQLLARSIPIQLWDGNELVRRVSALPDIAMETSPRPYQEEAIQLIVREQTRGATNHALIVMATGLGKTFVAAESLRRIMAERRRVLKVLVLAHTNELVYQLERSFWPFLRPSIETLVWNGPEPVTTLDIDRAPIVFATVNSVAGFLQAGGDLPAFDLLLIDECHHVGGSMYRSILADTRAGQQGGPFLMGLTATPWRPDDIELESYFGPPLITVDIVTGLRKGFLTNVDYRLYTDNIDWDGLRQLQGSRFSPRQINRSLFIREWDEAVVHELRRTWNEQPRPRALVFCGTIDHAVRMRDRINALGFCNAAAIYSSARGHQMSAFERNRVLSDFHDGTVNVVCAVDIFNEGVDVPDVNIVVFQRVTHSRRIFVQQLGRGLRIAPEKEKVIVLDFVSDIRRFAAGIELKDALTRPSSRGPQQITLPHKVTFRRAGGSEDPTTEAFLREWLEDVTAVEEAGEDVALLKFPPAITGR